MGPKILLGNNKHVLKSVDFWKPFNYIMLDLVIFEQTHWKWFWASGWISSDHSSYKGTPRGTRWLFAYIKCRNHCQKKQNFCGCQSRQVGGQSGSNPWGVSNWWPSKTGLSPHVWGLGRFYSSDSDYFQADCLIDGICECCCYGMTSMTSELRVTVYFFNDGLLDVWLSRVRVGIEQRLEFAKDEWGWRI